MIACRRLDLKLDLEKDYLKLLELIKINEISLLFSQFSWENFALVNAVGETFTFDLSVIKNTNYCDGETSQKIKYLIILTCYYQR